MQTKRLVEMGVPSTDEDIFFLDRVAMFPYPIRFCEEIDQGCESEEVRQRLTVKLIQQC